MSLSSCHFRIPKLQRSQTKEELMYHNTTNKLNPRKDLEEERQSCHRWDDTP